VFKNCDSSLRKTLHLPTVFEAGSSLIKAVKKNIFIFFFELKIILLLPPRLTGTVLK
jgi:hypothetical protein